MLDIADVLRLVPGFQVALASGTDTVATYHGLSKEWQSRLLVRIDGRAVYLPMRSTVDWHNLGIDIDDIERIEVIRGPDAPAYGANAFAAVINIITRAPALERGTSIRLTGGALKTREAVVRHGDRLGDLDYVVTARYWKDHGFKQQDDTKQLHLLSLRGTYHPNATDVLDLQLGYSGGPMGVAADGPSNPADPYRDKKVNSRYEYLRWTRTSPLGSALQVQFYHNFYDIDELQSFGLLSTVAKVTPAQLGGLFAFLCGQVTPFDNPACDASGQPYKDQEFFSGSEDGTAERYDLELQQTAVPTGRLRLVLGTSLRMDRLRSPLLLDRPDFINDRSVRLFGNLEWRASEATVFNLGLMAEHNQIIGTALSPRIAVNHHLGPHQTVRASITRAERTPSLLEQNFRRASHLSDGSVLRYVDVSDGVQPEKLTSYELGWLGELPSMGLFADVKLFHEDLSDIISDVPDRLYAAQPFAVLDLSALPGDVRSSLTTANVYVNSGHLTRNGVELEGRYKPDDATLLAVQYAYLQVHGRWLIELHPVAPNTVQYERLNDSAPRHTLSALFTHRFPGGLNASVGFYGTSYMYWRGEGKRLPKWRRIDLRLGKDFRVGSTDGEIAAIIQGAASSYPEFEASANAVNLFEHRAYLQLRLNMP